MLCINSKIKAMASGQFTFEHQESVPGGFPPLDREHLENGDQFLAQSSARG